MTCPSRADVACSERESGFPTAAFSPCARPNVVARTSNEERHALGGALDACRSVTPPALDVCRSGDASRIACSPLRRASSVRVCCRVQHLGWTPLSRAERPEYGLIDDSLYQPTTVEFAPCSASRS